MKNKILKAFTLVELIIVMAIIVIISSAMMQMMSPIRTVFLDSTYYEEQRNTQNGMLQYITESTRYATNMGVYNGSTIQTEKAAIEAFETYIGLVEPGVGATQEEEDEYDNYLKSLCVITIDNKTPYINRNKEYYGRILRSKKITNTNNIETRVALGEAFYGDNTYSISLVPNELSKSMNVSVASLHANLLGNTKDTDEISSDKNVLTTGEVFLRNVEISKKYDIDLPNSTTTQGQKTFIVFTLPD